MSETIKREINPDFDQSVVFSCPSNVSFNPNDSLIDSKYCQMNGLESDMRANVWPSTPIYYWNDLWKDLDFRSIPTNDLLALIEGKLIECNNKSLEVIQRSNEKFDNYLQKRENYFLKELKNTEKRMDHKLDSIATDLKIANQRLDSIKHLIQNSDSKLNSISEEIRDEFQTSNENLKTCLTTLLSIDSTVRKNSSKDLSYQLPVHSSKEKNKQLKSFCEPIANKLSEDLRSVIADCFNDFKKTIIREKIMEVIGEDNDLKISNNFSDSKNDSKDTDIWLSSMLLRNGGTDVESLRSKALDLLNDSKIIESFTIALNLCEPEFVCHLCSAFQNCPQKLFTELKKSKDSQKLFIDLLDQLFTDGVIDSQKRWKIPFIGGLILRVDMKCSISKSSVPRLADHWSTIMANVAEMGGQDSQVAKLLAISLKHISTDFY